MGKANYEGSVQDGKTIGLIAYLTLIGLIIAFVMNNEKKCICIFSYQTKSWIDAYRLSSCSSKCRTNLRLDSLSFGGVFL